jgi:YhcH/YjgK/YiaL family protein
MVCDHINYASEYFNLSPGIRRALEYLRQTNLDALPAGRTDVDGDAVFALVSDYDTTDPENTFWEAHRRHVDVQYVHTGVERIGVGDLSRFEVDLRDDAKDLTVAKNGTGRSVQVGAGQFVILFPHDVHMPGLSPDRVERVRKIVVKVRIGS